jgi:hypothetical protein
MFLIIGIVVLSARSSAAPVAEEGRMIPRAAENPNNSFRAAESELRLRFVQPNIFDDL